MSTGVSYKSSNAQLFRLMIYNRPLHPELFELQNRNNYRTSDYEVENWLIPAGHAVRFQVGDFSITEAVLESGDHLPENGLLHALPCVGEKDFNFSPNEHSPLSYVTAIQTEALTDNLYNATFNEMVDFASEAEALSFRWHDEDGADCLSVLEARPDA